LSVKGGGGRWGGGEGVYIYTVMKKRKSLQMLFDSSNKTKQYIMSLNPLLPGHFQVEVENTLWADISAIRQQMVNAVFKSSQVFSIA
jgi:hypothetical protein